MLITLWAWLEMAQAALDRGVAFPSCLVPTRGIALSNGQPISWRLDVEFPDENGQQWIRCVWDMGHATAFRSLAALKRNRAWREEGLHHRAIAEAHQVVWFVELCQKHNKPITDLSMQFCEDCAHEFDNAVAEKERQEEQAKERWMAQMWG